MTQQKNIKDLSFLDHVFELRGHMIRSIIAIVLGSILVAVFWDFILSEIIMAPLKSEFATFQFFNRVAEAVGMDPVYPDSFDKSKELRNLVPSGQITSQIYAILICGLIISIPYVVWEIWRFIKPGLTDVESKYANGTVFAITFFFLLGVAFSYYMLLPLSTNFLFSYNPFQIQNEWTLMSYINMFVQTLLAMGIVFLLPVFAYFLAKVGILTPDFMITYRKHALVVIMVIAAAVTPSDIMSMMIAAFPLWLLYEFSIVVTRYVYNKQLKLNAKNELTKS